MWCSFHLSSSSHRGYREVEKGRKRAGHEKKREVEKNRIRSLCTKMKEMGKSFLKIKKLSLLLIGRGYLQPPKGTTPTLTSLLPSLSLSLVLPHTHTLPAALNFHHLESFVRNVYTRNSRAAHPPNPPLEEDHCPPAICT